MISFYWNFHNKFIQLTSFNFSLRNAVQPFGGFLGETIASFFFLWTLIWDLLPLSFTGPFSTSLIVLFREAKPEISLLKQSTIKCQHADILLLFSRSDNMRLDWDHDLHAWLYLGIITRKKILIIYQIFVAGMMLWQEIRFWSWNRALPKS